VANFIQVNYVHLSRSLTRKTLEPLILLLAQDLVSQGILGQEALNCQCSYHFRESFLQRFDLSFRRSRPARRPAIGDGECAQFMINVLLVVKLRPPDHIRNFDESNWFLVMAGDQKSQIADKMRSISARILIISIDSGEKTAPMAGF
jgi:hypothetical protein